MTWCGRYPPGWIHWHIPHIACSTCPSSTLPSSRGERYAKSHKLQPVRCCSGPRTLAAPRASRLSTFALPVSSPEVLLCTAQLLVRLCLDRSCSSPLPTPGCLLDCFRNSVLPPNSSSLQNPERPYTGLSPLAQHSSAIHNVDIATCDERISLCRIEILSTSGWHVSEPCSSVSE